MSVGGYLKDEMKLVLPKIGKTVAELRAFGCPVEVIKEQGFPAIEWWECKQTNYYWAH